MMKNDTNLKKYKQFSNSKRLNSYIIKKSRRRMKEGIVMKIAVTYFSRTGNTKRLAEAMAETAGCLAEDISTIDISETIDLLYVGGAIYGGKLDISLLQFISRLEPEKVKRVVVFNTYAFGETANTKMKELFENQRIQVDDRSFACKGKFLFFNRRRPNSADLKKAKDFVSAII